MPFLTRPGAVFAGRLPPAALALLLVLAACSGDEVPVACPEVVRVQDASRLTRFAETGRDLTDVLFEAELKRLQLFCEYDAEVVEASLKVTFEALRGPADRRGRAPIRYFVAIATRNQDVVLRQEFDLEIPFPGSRTRVAISEELAPRIPLKSGESASDYRIYVGFALSPGEMRYNRRRR